MQAILSLLTWLIFASSCQNSSSTTPGPVDSTADPKKSGQARDSIAPQPLKPYEDIQYQKTEILAAAPGTKSVLFNSTGSKLYAMNLEGMSVYEFDQPSRKIVREFKFSPTKGTGWDYVKEKSIPSFQEKPVEACLSHQDGILWVSLHNAGGIVPILLEPDTLKRKADLSGQPVKQLTVIYPGSDRKDQVSVPLILTGKTPKVIAKTADSKYLLVSNWHSYSVSVLELDRDNYPYGKVIREIPVSSIPRGIVVDDIRERSYIAIMGGASIAVLNNHTWEKQNVINVASNPRHVVMDDSNRLYVSYNSLGTVACLDAETGKTLFSTRTHATPRTIVLSKNKKFLFVTCYTSDQVDVFKINENGFSKVTSFSCKGHPVGVDVFEDDNKLEAWVCSYSSGSISVYSFKKN